jgi:hypothetical protein
MRENERAGTSVPDRLLYSLTILRAKALWGRGLGGGSSGD